MGKKSPYYKEGQVFLRLLKLSNLMKRLLWGFSSCQIWIRHNNWDKTIFCILSPIPAQLPFLPNRTNLIKCTQKTPSTVETYNFLLLHMIFYRSMRVRSFECVVWKNLAINFVVWKLEHISNFLLGDFFIWQCLYAHLIRDYNWTIK